MVNPERIKITHEDLKTTETKVKEALGRAMYLQQKYEQWPLDAGQQFVQDLKNSGFTINEKQEQRIIEIIEKEKNQSEHEPSFDRGIVEPVSGVLDPKKIKVSPDDIKSS